MEIGKFVYELEQYYGKHVVEYVQNVVIAYVVSHYDPNDYEDLIQAIMKSHPHKFGFPDVSAIEDSQSKLWVKEGKSLKKEKIVKEWHSDIKPVTEKEREAAEKNREKWNVLVKEAAQDNKKKTEGEPEDERD